MYIKMARALNPVLYAKLQADIDDIARQFIIIFKLKFSGNISNLSSPVQRWLDFRMRYVSPRPRKIIYSNSFPKILDNDVQDAWDFLADKISKGENINQYQGRGLIETNDTSGLNSNKRTDLLWASWGILHFHLTKKPISPDKYFSCRSNYQVFCAVNDETVAVIDIRKHPRGEGYSDPSFLHIMAESWPQTLDHVEIKGMQPEKELKANEIHQLRSAGINSMITIKGKNYMNPGIGLTSAGTALKIMLLHIKLDEAIRILADLIELEPVFKKDALSEGIYDSDFGLRITISGVTLYEEKSGTAFNIDIPSLPILQILLNFLFPKWAVEEYNKELR